MVEYNNYPKEFKPRTLKRGEVVEYELVNIGKSVLDPTGQTWAIPPLKGSDNEETIMLTSKDGEPGYYNIALIKNYNPDGTIVPGDIHFKGANAGVIRLVGGNPMDQKQFEYMELSNRNASNPHRNPSVKPIFRLIDKKAVAVEKRKTRNMRKEAEAKAVSLSLAEVSQIYIGMGNPDVADEETMRDAIEIMAETTPEKFLMASENKDYTIMEVALTAEKKGLIMVDYNKRQVRSQTGEVLVSWTPDNDGKDWKIGFVSFVRSDSGSAFYKEIVEMLKSKKK